MNRQIKPKRRSTLWKVAIVVVLTVAICIGIFILVRPTPVNIATLGTSGSTQPAPIGISYGDTLPWVSPSVLSQTLDDAVAEGVTTIRLDLSWDVIQPKSPSVYNWADFDRVVQAAQSRHLTLLPILAYTPAWARQPGCTTQKCAPADPNAFATFAAAAATRYAPQGIHTWEIWNEPNIVTFWQPAPNVTQYVNLLGATSKAIKAVDPQSFIVSGGLAPSATSGGNIAPLDFLSQLANQGGISMVDAIGDHAYSYPVPPGYNVNWNPWRQMASTSPSIESILAAHGAANKKIWITEYGAPTNGPGALATTTNYNLKANPDHVNEALQAQMANDSVRLARSLSYVGALYWYSYKDLGTAKSDRENFFGLRRFDGSAKPAWQSLQSAISATNVRPSQKPRHFRRGFFETPIDAVCCRDRITPSWAA
jgi:polysaccharide biosynthesis protein PslG